MLFTQVRFLLLLTSFAVVFGYACDDSDSFVITGEDEGFIGCDSYKVGVFMSWQIQVEDDEQIYIFLETQQTEDESDYLAWYDGRTDQSETLFLSSGRAAAGTFEITSGPNALITFDSRDEENFHYLNDGITQQWRIHWKTVKDDDSRLEVTGSNISPYGGVDFYSTIFYWTPVPWYSLTPTSFEWAPNTLTASQRSPSSGNNSPSSSSSSASSLSFTIGVVSFITFIVSF